MQIAANTVVSLTYRLSTMDNELLEEALEDTPAAYLHGGYDGIFPKVEGLLEGKDVGEELILVLEPEDAFGDYDPELLRMEALSEFPEQVEIGMQFEGYLGDGDRLGVFTVTDIADDKVVVDGNHPLAGQRLHLSCKVLAVRAATAEEVAHGHVHGPHGHDHDGGADEGPDAEGHGGCGTGCGCGHSH